MDKKYTNGKRYHNIQIEQMTTAWFKLCDEYFLLVKDQRGKSKLRKSTKKMALLHEISIIEQLIKQISYVVLNKNLLPLSAYNGFITQTSSSVKEISLGLELKENESVFDWIKRIRKYMDGLITRHSLSEKDLETKDDIVDKEPNIGDFYSEKAYLEMALEKNHIPEDICMTEWVIYKNQAFKMIKKHG